MVKQKNKIVKMEDILSGLKTTTQNSSGNIATNRKTVKKKNIEEIPRGKPKSGKVWKNKKTKFSTIIKTKGIRNSFERKEALRKDLLRVKEASRAIIAKKAEEVELKKQRRRDNMKKQEENRKKSEVVQVITNTKKLKNMRKKQLRHIEKRDTNNM